MKALITGAGGFLGFAIVKRLIERGDQVVGLHRGDYPALKKLGVVSVRGDLADAKVVQQAATDCDVVFHVAAKAGVWGTWDKYYQTNVVGTRNVIDACRVLGIEKLIYTSSPSVTFSGQDENGIDESAPYAEKFLTYYPHTKAIAEQEVLQANGIGKNAPLSTVALRPHLMWGPGDPHLVPRIVERAKAVKLRLVGDGQNMVDSTYIENAAAVHISAADRLNPQAACAGKAYFISNGEPLPMVSLINKILNAAGLKPVDKKISPKVAYCVGAMMEAWHRLTGNKTEPLMTRFVARQLATAHWYNLDAARRDLGYEPSISIDQGMKNLAASLEVVDHREAVV